VDDAAAALLMVRFYENLLGKRKGLNKALGRAEALAEAKKWLSGLSRKEAESRMASLARGMPRGKFNAPLPNVKVNRPGDRPFSQPRYWAAFVLLGEAD
jgi:CHAT domain-containing protein